MSGARGEGPEAGAGGAGGRAAPENPGGVLSLELPGLLAQLARSFALLLPVYALGYLGLSFSWVLLALALLAWCRRSRGLKALRLCRALALLEDEERAVRLGVRACDLPAWGHFPLEEKRSLFPVRSKA
nr:extended synaptotagmin-2-like [Macaca nemestrina]